MHNQEVHSKILDSETLTVTISDWNAGTYLTSTITDDVRFDTTDVSHPINQNVTLTN